MSTISGYGVADVSHVAMLSNFGGTCVSDKLRLGPSAGYGGLNHHNVCSNLRDILILVLLIAS